VGVRRRGPRRFILGSREQFPDSPRRVSPLLGGSIAKYVRHASPAHIAGEHGFFRVGGVAVLRFEGFEEPDGGDIVAGLLMRPALADAVGVRYPEVAGRFCFRL